MPLLVEWNHKLADMKCVFLIIRSISIFIIDDCKLIAILSHLLEEDIWTLVIFSKVIKALKKLPLNMSRTPDSFLFS